METLGRSVATMRIDSHVHSRFSERSTEWFMERWGIAESYSDPIRIYETARRAGMSHVTLTDHNSIEGCLLLKERFGDRVVVGVESTAYFPEDRCKIHILIYGMREKEFGEIQELRKDIYELRDYLSERRLAHSVAHATYSIQPGVLTLGHLEKLIVLFDVFEVINGGRNRKDNSAWQHILENLTPDCLDALSRKHGLRPRGAEPWVKGFTAGSDDHGGIFIGKTYTEVAGASVDDFIRAMKSKKTTAHGRHSDYQSLVFSIYKVIHDYTRATGNGETPTFVGRLVNALFEGKRMGVTDRIRINRLRARAKKSRNSAYMSLFEAVDRLGRNEYNTLDEAIQLVYACASGFSDGFLTLLCTSLGRDVAKMDLVSTIRNVQSSLPALFLPMPFLMTLRHLNQNRALVERLMADLQVEKPREGHRVLWFTDTLNELNGVAVTLREVGWFAHERGLDLKIATSADTRELAGLFRNIMNLPSIHRLNLPYYESYSLKVPSLLKSLEEIHRFDPDVIYISTPGPLGLLGLAAARLMQIKCVGFYHTDFKSQAEELVEDESVSAMLEWYTRWFYSAMDEIKVPTLKYMDILERRGFDPGKMSLFRRGIDTDLFKPYLRRIGSSVGDARSLERPVTLLYVGRVSPDKGLDFLIRVFGNIRRNRPHLRLLIVGDGPSIDTLKVETSGEPVVFAGRVAHESLPPVYGNADLFVFPSTTDTFGKVVLEAQACGLPSIVSDIGGPQEIVVHGKTGFVAKAGNYLDWTEKIEHVLGLMETSPGIYRKMREDARAHVVDKYEGCGTLEFLLDCGTLGERDVEQKIA